MRGDRAGEAVCAEHEPQAARARRRASPRPASSAAARCRTAHGSIAARPCSRPSTSLRRLGVRLAEERLAEVRPLLAEAADEPLHARDADARAADRTGSCASARARRRPPRRARATGRPGRSDCQSWFPSTATTGTCRSRHASATTHTSSTWPCCVRSPASRIRSACVLDALERLAHTVAARPRRAWMSPAAATRIVFAMSGSLPRIGAMPLAGTDSSSMAERRTSSSELLGRDEARRRRAARRRGPVRARGRPRRSTRAAARATEPRRRLPAARGGRRARARAARRCGLPLPSARPRAGSTRSTTTNDVDDRPDLRAEQPARARSGRSLDRADRARGLRDHAAR